MDERSGVTTTTAEELREEVRRRYAESARAVSEGTGRASCGGGCVAPTLGGDADSFGEALYDAEQRGELPEGSAPTTPRQAPSRRFLALCRSSRRPSAARGAH